MENVFPVNELIARGPGYQLACYSAANGNDYDFYVDECLGGSIMCISRKEYNEIVIPSVKRHIELVKRERQHV